MKPASENRSMQRAMVLAFGLLLPCVVVPCCGAVPAAVEQSPVAVYRSPLNVVFSPDGRTLAVSDHTTMALVIIDPKTKKIIGTLKDPKGQRVMSSKFIEIHFRDGRPIRVGQQMGMGRVTD